MNWNNGLKWFSWILRIYSRNKWLHTDEHCPESDSALINTAQIQTPLWLLLHRVRKFNFYMSKIDLHCAESDSALTNIARSQTLRWLTLREVGLQHSLKGLHFQFSPLLSITELSFIYQFSHNWLLDRFLVLHRGYRHCIVLPVERQAFPSLQTVVTLLVL